MNEKKWRPVVLMCMQALVVEGAVGQQAPAEAGAPVVARGAPPRRATLREAVQAQQVPHNAQARHERRLTPEEHAELRRQLWQLSAERRAAEQQRSPGR